MVCVKIFKNLAPETEKTFIAEVQSAHQLGDHKNVLKTWAAGQGQIEDSDGTKSDLTAYIVSELACNGEAFDYVAAAGGLNDKFTRGLFLQVLDGVEHMHVKGVAHRDIKLENIFLDENVIPKVADFGLAKAFAGDNAELLTTKLGTKNYMAPELYSQE